MRIGFLSLSSALTLNKGHTLIKDYLHTSKFEAFLNYQLHKVLETDTPTDMCKAIIAPPLKA